MAKYELNLKTVFGEIHAEGESNVSIGSNSGGLTLKINDKSSPFKTILKIKLGKKEVDALADFIA